MKKITKVFTLLLTIATLAFVVSCNDKTPTIESVSVVETTLPGEILTTEVNDKIDDIKLLVTKSDDSTEEVNVTLEMISADDLAKLANEGTHTIIINYEGKTVTISLVTKKPEETKPDPDPNPTPNPEGIKYSVLVKDIAGKPLSNFYVTFYLGKEKKGEGNTNNSGLFETELLADIYDVKVEAKEGYILNTEMYKTDLIGTQIEVTAELDSFAGIEADASTKRYQKGDLMYDFTVYDVFTNKELTLYDLLDEENGGYKAVILNFWYTTCSACIAEFPFMIEAYDSVIAGTELKYSDEVAIITINNTFAGGGETVDEVKLFAENMGFNFFTAIDYDYDDTNLTMDAALTAMFSVDAYPTTVIIDRYGLIAELEEGAVTATEKWTETFDKYIADNYTPEYSGDGDEETGGYKAPDVEHPDYDSLSVINGTNHDGTTFDGVYSREDNDDADITWPWIIEELDGKTCIRPSNKDQNPSFATIYMTTNLKKGEALAFDYFSSTESYDKLYVTVDGVIATNISGMSPEWEKSYCFVALEDGEYEFGFCYLKDGSSSHGKDGVYINNVRVVKEEQIDKATYIFRECATGTINKFNMSYPSYATVVYNEEDGYYHVCEKHTNDEGHVCDKNGAYLFADMLSGTQWNNSTLYEISLEGLCIGADGKDYNLLVEEYSIYASNSEIGYTPVTKELADALKQIVKKVGDPKAKDNINQWLEVCVYYSAYASDNVGISITGVCPWEPIVFEGNGIDEEATAAGVFDRIILPRGLIFGFTPEVSGAYKFYGTEEVKETDCWVCDENGDAIQEADLQLRKFAQNIYNGIDNGSNFIVHVYLEAGKTYLFRASFYDIYEYSEITVGMKYIAPELDLLTGASPGVFTSSDDEMSDIISGNYVDVELVDGYYQVIGSQAADKNVYADIKYINNITGHSLEVCLSEKYNSFDFTKDEFGYKIVDEEGYIRITAMDEEYNIYQQYLAMDAEGNTVGVDEKGLEGYTYATIPLDKLEEAGYSVVVDGTVTPGLLKVFGVNLEMNQLDSVNKTILIKGDVEGISYKSENKVKENFIKKLFK